MPPRVEIYTEALLKSGDTLTSVINIDVLSIIEL